MSVGPQIKKMLERYGLESLADWITMKVQAGATMEEIELEMYDRPEFIERFPAIRKRGQMAREQGWGSVPPLSVEEYLQYEKYAHAMASRYGVSLTKGEVEDLLTYGVDVEELEERFVIAASAYYDSAVETRDALERLYGVTPGQMIKYWMQPDKELQVLKREFESARIAGAAKRAQFQEELTKVQAERLYKWGMTEERALQGFGELTRLQGLMRAQDRTEEDIDTDTQVNLLIGDAEAMRRVEERQRRRNAQFQGGGGFAIGDRGVAGLGQAS